VRIRRLHMQELGRHRDLDIEFARGLTVVRGPNEAGKSTIQRAIELALFRKPTATSAELESLRNWGAGPEDRIRIGLEFEVDAPEVAAIGTEAGVSATGAGNATAEPTPAAVATSAIAAPAAPVLGTLEKEYRGAKGRVRLELDGQVATDPARVDELLASLTGIPSEGFFRSTASIRHEELADLDRDEGTLRDRLQAGIGGGDRGSSRAIARLEDALRSLRSRGDRNPGRLKIAEEAVARAEGALATGEAALTRLAADRDALASAREARQDAEAALAESRGLLDSARQADRLRAERDVALERYDRLRQAVAAQAHVVELEEGGIGPELPELREGIERVRLLQDRVDVLRETLDEVLPALGDDEPVPSSKGFLAGTLIALLAGVALLAAGLAGMPVLVPVGIGALATSAVVGWLLRTTLARAGAARRRNLERERERTLRHQTRVGAEEGLRVANGGVKTALRELGVHDVPAAEQVVADEEERVRQVEKLRAQVSALLGDLDPEGAREARDRAALELEQKVAALRALGPIAEDARARERLDVEVRERASAVERARDAEAAAAARIEANGVDAEQVAGEAERLGAWRDQLEALRRRARVYERTLSAITEAEGATMRRATRYLETEVGQDIGRVTGGRYERVRIDDQTLDVAAWSPERGDWVAPGQLSKGTLDQVFLAARIGLVRLVTAGRRPPLILDDPFVTFDDRRAARAAALLRELSADFQVIYLTCSDRYDALADAVVELPGPADAVARG
jgi:uncharacterized protein YhaN